MIYTIGLLNNAQYQINSLADDMHNQINDIKLDIEYICKELEGYNNINDDILDIYNKIDNLHGIIESYQTSSNAVSSTEETIDAVDTNEEQYDNIEISKEKDDDGIYDDMSDMYYGRLYIPDLNINVALYYGYHQYITDRVDSANIFSFDYDPGYTIADHNYQAFTTLFNIQAGTKGYIEHKSFGRIDIECVDVFSGYNNGRQIVDENGVNAMDRTDYMMYTCEKGSEKVLICLWNII